MIVLYPNLIELRSWGHSEAPGLCQNALQVEEATMNDFLLVRTLNYVLGVLSKAYTYDSCVQRWR